MVRCLDWFGSLFSNVKTKKQTSIVEQEESLIPRNSSVNKEGKSGNAKLSSLYSGVKDKASFSIPSESLKEKSKSLISKSKEGLLIKSKQVKDQIESKVSDGQIKDKSVIDSSTKGNVKSKLQSLKDKVKDSRPNEGEESLSDQLKSRKEILLNSKDSLKTGASSLFGNAKDNLLNTEKIDDEKEKLLQEAGDLKDKILDKKNIENQKNKLRRSVTSLGNFVKKTPLINILDYFKLLFQKLKQGLKSTWDHLRSDTPSGVGKAKSPILTKWSEMSLKLSSIPWTNKLIDRFLNIKIWSKEKIFYKYTMPTLVSICVIFLVTTSCLYFFMRSTINDISSEVRDDIVKDKTQQLIISKQDYIIERSEEIQSIIRDNTNKTSLLANSPTFQTLDIQKMEEFSRSLLMRDSNLLNVVVLTHDEVKANIRTRRIGEDTDFIFSCCEVNEDRQVNYDEISEESWLVEIDSVKNNMSQIYANPINDEQYFYHGSNIEDFKGTQNGAILLRYNLNFAIRNLKKYNKSGVNYLITNDTLIIASSLDSLFPIVETLSMTEALKAGPTDYFTRLINIIQKAKTAEQAIDKIANASFISDPAKFIRKFGDVIPGELAAEPSLDSLGEGTWLSYEQAESLLNLSFGQLLRLNAESIDSTLTDEQKEVVIGKDLAMAYLDSIKIAQNGFIIDDNYLFSFATNDFGWTLINQSSAEEFRSEVHSMETGIKSLFDILLRFSLWSFLLSSLFLILLFSLLITGFMKRFTKPIKDLVSDISSNTPSLYDGMAFNSGDELSYLGDKFSAMDLEIKSYVNKLKQSNVELEQYAHMVSHDLRAPLRTIGSFTQLLEKKLGYGSDEKINSYLGLIKKGTKQMDEMIQGMLTYATLKKKLDKNGYYQVSLNDEFDIALSNLNEKIDSFKPEIHIPKLPLIRFKGTNLALVFQNLIDNSIKYRAPERPLKITVTHEYVDNKSIIIIADNGLGIPIDKRELVFDMFYKKGNQKDSKGIGLASCKTIIDTGGGAISIVNTPASTEGVAFEISFPREAESNETDQSSEEE